MLTYVQLVEEVERLGREVREMQTELRRVTYATKFKDKEIELPDHLYKTYKVLAHSHNRECSAGDIAKITGRARAVESLHCNQLITLGIVGKRREGRIVVFYLRTRGWFR